MKMHYVCSYVYQTPVLTSLFQTFGCPVSHLGHNFDCLSATAAVSLLSAGGACFFWHFTGSSNAVGRSRFISNSWRYSCCIITAVNLSSYK